MDLNENIVKYIEEKIFPQYDTNIGGHGIEHVKNVINRSFELNELFHLNLNPNMVYVIAAFHDMGYKVDPENHEQVSADMFYQDEVMKYFFSDEDRQIIYEAIIDHRASLEYEARSVYGKLVSSADRAIDIDIALWGIILFQRDKHKDENLSDLDIIEYAYKKLASKYGKGGYAKMYFPDQKYQDFLNSMQKLVADKEKFIEKELSLIRAHK